MAIAGAIVGKLMTFSIHGIINALKFLKERQENLNENVEDSIVESTEYVAKEVRASISGHRAEPTSVDTGRFLGSVRGVIKGKSGSVETNVEYAPFLEYGTSKMAARRHFRNSLERSRKKVEEYVKKAVFKI